MLEVLLALHASGRLKRKNGPINFAGKRGRIGAIVIALFVLVLLVITVVKNTSIV